MKLAEGPHPALPLRRIGGITEMAPQNPLSLAFVMDPIDAVSIEADTTFVLMLEAQARGHQVFYVDPARGRNLVRFACCKRPEVIDEAVERLGRLKEGLA